MTVDVRTIRDRVRTIVSADERTANLNPLTYVLAGNRQVAGREIVHLISVISAPEDKLPDDVPFEEVAPRLKAAIYLFGEHHLDLFERTVWEGVVNGLIPREAHSLILSAIWEISCPECRQEHGTNGLLCDEHLAAWHALSEEESKPESERQDPPCPEVAGLDEDDEDDEKEEGHSPLGRGGTLAVDVGNPDSLREAAQHLIERAEAIESGKVDCPCDRCKLRKRIRELEAEVERLKRGDQGPR